MAEELEKLWSKLSFTEEEDDGIELGISCTKAARAIGKNCVVLKVLTQRSISLDALRKNLRMLWKPNKSLQISEIEDELFMAEFGDTKDKQRVLNMCPWSFEKQLVILQEFEGELVPKDIVMKWSPFWVQIFNLPLKSRTKETGWTIGAKLGEVMEVDVPDSGVQWGKCLRVRVRIDVSKRLVRGKKVIIEGGESRWVQFKYERLPNFCYECGMLNHAVKECPEKSMEKNQLSEGHMQYGAWLRGEPLRRNGWEPNQTGIGPKEPNRRNFVTGEPKKSGLQSREPAEEQNGVVGHVSISSNAEPSDQRRGVLRTEASREAEADLHGNGKVSGLVEKSASKETLLDDGEWVLAEGQTDQLSDMQWEKDLVQKKEPLFEFNLAPKVLTERKEEGPNPEIGPVAMSYDPKEGWVSEKLGPNSKHWKRLAREVKEKGLGTNESPGSQKREGPTPLQELDPNALSKKKRKGKSKVCDVVVQHKHMDGDEAVAAMQPRRAQ